MQIIDGVMAFDSHNLRKRGARTKMRPNLQIHAVVVGIRVERKLEEVVLRVGIDGQDVFLKVESLVAGVVEKRSDIPIQSGCAFNAPNYAAHQRAPYQPGEVAGGGQAID